MKMNTILKPGDRVRFLWKTINPKSQAVSWDDVSGTVQQVYHNGDFILTTKDDGGNPERYSLVGLRNRGRDFQLLGTMTDNPMHRYEFAEQVSAVTGSFTS